MPQLAVPKNVLRFERLGYLTVVFGSLAAMLADWPTIMKFSQQYPVVYPAAIALAWVLQLLWIWIIARKRQNWARCLSVAIIGGSILKAALNFKAGYQANPMAELVNGLIHLMWIVEFSFLFRSDAKMWFTTRPGSVSPLA